MSRVTREEAIKFLECACRNWSKVPELSEDDIGDVASELLRFSLAAKAEEREACALLLEDVGIDIQDRFAAAEAIRNRGNVSTVRKSENQEG